LLEIDPSNQSETSPELILVRNSEGTASYTAPHPPHRISHHNHGTHQYSNPSPHHKSSSSELDYPSALQSSSSEEYIVKPMGDGIVFEDGVLGLRDLVTILYVNDVRKSV
jgi:hypothetical protein